MTTTLIDKALTAKRESRTIEFKQEFDCDSKGEWCEVIKDIVAMANSGGIIVFGLDDKGYPLDSDISRIAALDPADISNKIGAYIGSREIDVDIQDLRKNDRPLVGFVVGPAPSPYVFEKHGGYPDLSGKQKSAFAVGTCYFRHGAKSEPATNEDLRKSISNRVETIRKEWLTGVRKVVEAPAGSHVVITASGEAGEGHASKVRISSDPQAVPVRLTRSLEGAEGTLMHEEISDALLNEINNVIEMNSRLFRGQTRFLLGQQIYFRVYAERHHVKQAEAELGQLLDFGITEYSPFLYWCTLLSSQALAKRLAQIVLSPKGNEVSSLLRLTPLLGVEFYRWLNGKFTEKWGAHSQPPGFYWRVKNTDPSLSKDDPRIQASRLSPQGQIVLADGSTHQVRELLGDGARLNAIVTNACLDVFKGDKEKKSTARDFDFLANGEDIWGRGLEIGGLIADIVGDQLPANREDHDVN